MEHLGYGDDMSLEVALVMKITIWLCQIVLENGHFVIFYSYVIVYQRGYVESIYQYLHFLNIYQYVYLYVYVYTYIFIYIYICMICTYLCAIHCPSMTCRTRLPCVAR